MVKLWKSNLELVTYTFQQHIIIYIGYTVNETP